MCTVALLGSTGQVPEQRAFWNHVKHLPWGLWESVPQQEAQQEGPDGGRQAGKAHLLLGIPHRGFAILGQPESVFPGQLSSELPRLRAVLGKVARLV